jgi:hypothetical protein
MDQHFHVPSEHEVRYAPLDASLTSTDFADTICTYGSVLVAHFFRNENVIVNETE